MTLRLAFILTCQILAAVFLPASSFAAADGGADSVCTSIVLNASKQNAWLKDAIKIGGSVIHPESKTSPIDADSDTDLELSKAILPLFSKHVTTAFGLKRLDYLLHNPFLQRDEIVGRQNAVKELMTNEPLRLALQKAFSLLDETDSDKVLDWLTNGDPQRGDTRRELVTGVMGVVLPLVAAADGLLTHNHDYLKAAAIMTIFIGSTNTSRMSAWRDDYSNYKDLLLALDQVRVALKSAESEHLREISQILEQGYAHPELMRTTQSLKSMVTSGFSRALDIAHISNITLRRLQNRIQTSDTGLVMLFGALGELEAYYALSSYALEDREQKTVPVILPEEGTGRLNITDGHHPFYLNNQNLPGSSIANSVELNQSASNFWLMTGVQMGGKSTLLRMVATDTILAQIGSLVPARAMELTPFAVLTNMAAKDSATDQDSLFKAQCMRASKVFAAAPKYSHVLLFLDEFGNGTSPEEQIAFAAETIRYSIAQGYMGIMSTQIRDLSRLANELPTLHNVHMGEDDHNRYRVQPGPATTRNATRVMTAQGLPAALVRSTHDRLVREGVYPE